MSDLTLTNGISYQQVTAVWGRPDFFPQTSLDYLSFQLENRQEVQILFGRDPPYRALGAFLIDQQKGTIKALF